jgi:hypothetical protein
VHDIIYPPPDLSTSNGEHPTTPLHAEVIFAKLYSQELGVPIPKYIIRNIAGIAERSQTRIHSSKQVRTFHNCLDSGPDSRNRKWRLLRSETVAIVNYLDDETDPLDDRGAS